MEILAFVVALSTDTLTASLSLGARKVRVPWVSVVVLNLLCTFFLVVSVFLGDVLAQSMQVDWLKYVGFGILLWLGIMRLLDKVVKKMIAKIKSEGVLSIYADSQKADANHSNSISVTEAVMLALALSLDSICAGFGFSEGGTNLLMLGVLNFVIGFVCTFSGIVIGRKMILLSYIDTNILSGILLIVLAFVRVV